jgi:2-polyprenyl-3-methyl-5-hydroxy-6-metoxy-1,4-benzoquinol methylase
MTRAAALEAALARHWRLRTYAAGVAAALAPAVAAGGAPGVVTTLALLLGWLAADLAVRRRRAVDRHRAETALLRALLARETIEAHYAEGRDEHRTALAVGALQRFGERPIRSVDPHHYLRRRWVAGIAARFIPVGARVLDLGCQHGLITAVFVERGDRVTGADLNPAALGLARALEPGFRVVRADVGASPFASGCADAIALTEVVEHVAEPAATLGEVARCLRPGGVVVITTNNRHGVTWTEWINPLAVAAKAVGFAVPRVLPPPAVLWRDDARRLAFYHTDFSAVEIRRLVRQAGLAIVSMRSYAHLGEVCEALRRVAPAWTERRAAAVLHRIDRVCNAIPVVRGLGMHWLIVARKPGPDQP